MLKRLVVAVETWLPILAVVLSLVMAWHLDWPVPVETTDEAQLRLDVPAPVPAPGRAVVQSLVAQHDGLVAIELLLAVYPPGDNADQATLTVRLLDHQERQIYGGSWQTSALAHNEPLRISFAPQAESGGRQYRVVLEGSEGNRATVWAYSLKGYVRGTLTAGGEPQNGALRFETIYRYRIWSAIQDLGRALVQHAWLYLLLPLMLVAPGLMVISPKWQLGRDPAALLGSAVAASVVVISFAWLWCTWLGFRVNGVMVILGLLCCMLLATRRWRGNRLRSSPETWLLAAVLIAGLVVRVLAVRDLALPPWVDSPQHLLITRMMAEAGTVPSGYRPWMPVDAFAYHLGFHALMASLLQIGNWSAAELILAGGQILNALAPLAVYSAAFLLTKRRRAALVAAFYVALLSLFPSYYLTWGRYTQLCGALVLGPLMGLVYGFFRSVEPRVTATLWGKALLVSLLVGGLYLVHARVWLFALVWVPVAAAGVWVVGPRSPGRGRRILGWLLGVNVLALVLVAPWHVRIIRQFLLTLVDQIGTRGDPGAYNAVPWAYLSYGWERLWIGLAAAGLVIASGYVLWTMTRARDRRAAGRPAMIVVIGVWVLAVTGLMNANKLGVPTFGLVNNNSWVISLFVPVGIALGWLVDEGIRFMARWRWGRAPVRAVLAAAVVLSGLYGMRQNIAIVNPETVLATKDDLALIERAESILPANAVVLVNGWLWMGTGSWAGSDAGYWILPLIGRETTMPPIGYAMDPGYLELVNDLNEALVRIEDWGAPATLDLLTQRGVTHVFVGARGGAIRPELLVGNPQYELLDTNGAAWLFAFHPEPSS